FSPPALNACVHVKARRTNRTETASRPRRRASDQLDDSQQMRFMRSLRNEIIRVHYQDCIQSTAVRLFCLPPHSTLWRGVGLFGVVGYLGEPSRSASRGA